MIDNIINSIIEAENRAQSEIKGAQLAAKDMIFRAEAERDSIKENNEKEVKQQVKVVLADAEKQAEIMSEAIIEEGRVASFELIKKASEKKAVAAKIIAGRIISKWQ